ncbi:MAG: MBOAT family protein [Oscillospiraceae bacterium]|nr:MBOAT family protein [Oscillospiraceae bacterium]
MVFSTYPFLFYFLPVFLALYYILPKKARNAVLLLASLLFYYIGEQGYALLLLFSSVLDYTAGRIIEKHRGSRRAKAALFASIFCNLLLLGFFKYSGFVVENLNALFGLSIPPLAIDLPLGISFYTFQTMSYTLDVYKGNVRVQRNLPNFMVYVTMFPQLVAGPIVRYRDVADKLDDRRHTWEGFATGATRFVVGLGKKLLLADTLGQLGAAAQGAAERSVLSCWLVVVSYMLQVYFDFSGYSDMAIGLGRIIGFSFPENFNYPFIAKSVSEFWRRWHISMGSWFRDYVYIPLGGNRVSPLKWARNIAVVWCITGLWHGAAWNFVLWGLYFGVFLVLEKLFLHKFMQKAPSALQRAYTLVVLVVSFVIFRFENVADIAGHLQGMAGLASLPAADRETLYYLRSYGPVLLIAALGATPVLRDLVGRLRSHRRAVAAIDALTPVFTVTLLLLAAAYCVDGSFSPFLYFRF